MHRRVARGAVALLVLLVVGACGPDSAPAPEVEAADELTPTGEVSEIDADGGRSFADRETFQRYCPVRSASWSQHFGAPFEPVRVYLAPAEPDGEPSSWERVRSQYATMRAPALDGLRRSRIFVKRQRIVHNASINHTVTYGPLNWLRITTPRATRTAH